MMRRFLEWLADTDWARARTKYVSRAGNGRIRAYSLLRIYLVRTRWFGLYLHRILGDDPDGLHDHPWDFAVLVVSGGYIEWTPTGPGHITGRIRRAGSFRFMRAESLHRLAFCDAWTLFARVRRRREWGFTEKIGVTR